MFRFIVVDSKTCILFFARTPEKEQAFKRLTHCSSVNLKLHQQLYNQTLNILKASCLPVITWHEKRQSYSTFGENLSEAIYSVFNRGFERILIIGGDCPQLSRSILKKALLNLRYGAVYSKTNDGGISLLGISRSHFDAQTFKNFDWESSQLESDLRLYFEARNIAFDVLGTMVDLDSTKDLSFFLAFAKNLQLTRIIMHLLQGHSLVADYMLCPLRHTLSNSLSLRGPPCPTH